MKLAIKNLFGIRFKLVFLSSFLLVIPWLGYRYILEMEEYLQLGQEQTVLGTAQALATALNERPELFNEGSYSPARRAEDLYVYPIFSPLELDDGSLVDWGEYQKYEVRYDYHNYLRTALNPARHYLNDHSLSFQNMVGEYDGSLYAYFKVQDEKVIYRDKEALSVYRSDFLQISMLARDGSGVKNYVVAPYGPEPVSYTHLTLPTKRIV